MSRLWGERARTARGGRTTALRVLAVLVVGVVLTLTSFTRLTSLAGALTGDTFTDAINSWSAVYQKGPGTGEGSWSRTDGSDALDESSDLRLRIAFDIPADGLAGGDSLRYALPSGLWIGDGTQVAVFASDTVGDPDESSARVIGYAQVYGRYNTTPYDKLKLDLTYIQHYSVGLDLKLMLLTLKILVQPESTEGVADGQTTALKEHESDRQ